MLGGAEVSVAIEQQVPLSGVRTHRRASALAEVDRLRAEAERTTLDVSVEAASAYLMLQERRRAAALVREQTAFARDVHAAIGGMPISTAIAGRARFSINLRDTRLTDAPIHRPCDRFWCRSSDRQRLRARWDECRCGRCGTGHSDDGIRWIRRGRCDDRHAGRNCGSFHAARRQYVAEPGFHLGLLPLLWEAGAGADVSARTAAPVVGGLWSCTLLTLLVLPATYAMWRRHWVRVAAAESLSHDVATPSKVSHDTTAGLVVSLVVSG
jgi:hypothetical protein